MLSYFIIIFIPVFLMWLDERIRTRNQIFSKLSFVFLIITGGLRWKFGNDYLAYYSMYNSVEKGVSKLQNIERGYYYLNKISSGFKLNFSGMLLIIRIFNIFLFSRYFDFFIKKSKYKWLGILMFLCLNEVYFFSLMAIRQGIAINLFLFSLIFIKKRDFIKFCLINLCGYLFHKSIIFLFLIESIFYLFKTKKSKQILMIMILFIETFIIFFKFQTIKIINLFLDIFLKGKYKGYLLSNLVDIRTGTGILMYAGIIFLLIFYYSKGRHDEKTELIVERLIIYYLIVLLSLTGIEIFYRVKMYYSAFFIYLPFIFIKYFKRKKMMVLFCAFIGISIFIKNYKQLENSLFERHKEYNLNYRIIGSEKDIYKNKIFYYDGRKAKVYWQ